MMKDNFKNLYTAISAILGNEDDTFQILMKAGVKDQIDVVELEKEMQTAQEILDAWEPPVLPFTDVTDEMIENDEKAMESRYGFVIISSQDTVRRKTAQDA